MNSCILTGNIRDIKYGKYVSFSICSDVSGEETSFPCVMTLSVYNGYQKWVQDNRESKVIGFLTYRNDRLVVAVDYIC